MKNKINIVAFSLTELSITIAIISILLISVVSGLGVVENARISAMHKDAEGYISAVNSFYLQHSCLPGACSRNYMAPKLPVGFGGTTSLCVNSINFSGVSTSDPVIGFSIGNIFFGKEAINCAFWEMSALGFLRKSDVVQYSNPAGQSSSNNVASYNLPIIANNDNLVWSLATVTSNIPSIPEFGIITSRPTEITLVTKARNDGQHLLVAMRALPNGSLINGASSKEYTDVCAGGTCSNSEFSSYISNRFTVGTSPGPLPSRMADKLDTKFDDGYPYTGNIVSGRNGADSASNSAANPTTPACTILTGALAVSTVEKGATYNTHSSAKCITAFLIGKLNNDESQ